LKKSSRTAVALLAGTLMATALPALTVAQDEVGATLEGPVWELMVADDAIPSGVDAAMQLSDGEAGVNGGCNTYFGSYELDGENLSFGPMIGTLMACEGPAQDVEDFFIPALDDVATYAIDGESLDLFDASGAVILTFEAETAATARDLAEMEIKIEATRAHVAELREHVHGLRIGHLADRVAALEAHVDTLTEQHFGLKAHHESLKKRVQADEKLMTELIKELIDEDIIDEDFLKKNK